jgi:hypothetical protein
MRREPGARQSRPLAVSLRLGIYHLNAKVKGGADSLDGIGVDLQGADELLYEVLHKSLPLLFSKVPGGQEGGGGRSVPPATNTPAGVLGTAKVRRKLDGSYQALFRRTSPPVRASSAASSGDASRLVLWQKDPLQSS